MRKQQSIYPNFETEQQIMAMYDSKMAEWPVPFEVIEVSTRFGKTHINAYGLKNAPPLILVHAMGVTSTMWMPNIAAFGQKYRIYAIDTIGDLGKSVLSNYNNYPKDGRMYSEWLCDVFDQLRIAKADLISASMGGWIAMNMAIYNPDRVNRLVLLGPMGLRLNLEVLFRLTWLLIKPTAAKKKSLIRWTLGENQSVQKAFGEYMYIATSCKGRMASPVKIAGSELRRLKLPVLLFLGGKDRAIGALEKAATRARKLISNLEVEILGKSGHLLSYEQPEMVNQRILRFLEK